jgi:aspartyl-tRNA(Asn)/glutamyl-tRNA(Gln) amidotransferase subunit C
MALSLDDVKEIARLARLELGDAEAEALRGDLAKILAYVETLQKLDTTGVAPMTHAVPMALPLRDDVTAPSLDPEDALAAAPKRDEDLFVVPKIIEAGS